MKAIQSLKAPRPAGEDESTEVDLLGVDSKAGPSRAGAPSAASGHDAGSASALASMRSELDSVKAASDRQRKEREELRDENAAMLRKMRELLERYKGIRSENKRLKKALA